MLADKLIFGLMQLNLHWEDKARNLQHISRKIDELDFDCDVLVLPEMFSTGFTMNAKELAEDMAGPTMDWIRETARKTGKMIVGSFIAEEKNRYFNRLVWMNPDGSFQFYDKKHLFRMAEEDAYYTAGNKNITIEVKGWKIRPLICYDLRFPVWSRNRHEIIDGNAVPEFDVLLYVANWPAVRSLPWDVLLRARAVENQVYCIGLNRVGMDGLEKEYNGHSAVIGPKGDYLLGPLNEKEGIFQVSINLQELMAFREKFPQGLDADNFELS